MNEVPKPESLSVTGNQRKVFIKTYGCQMNVYDSERMADALAAEGYAATGEIDEADLVVLNTCHIREKAAEKVYSELGRLRELKDERALAGLETMVARHRLRGAGRGRRDPAPRAHGRSRRRAANLSPPRRVPCGKRGPASRSSRPISQIEDKFEQPAARHAPPDAARGVTAFLTVQEGCDKFCTFCVVPYTRGAEVSRPVAQILAEARRLADAGRARDHAARPERQCLARRGAEAVRRWGLGDLLAQLAADQRRRRGCATPPAIRATWTMSLIEAHRDLPQADALPAPAGAVGLGPHPQGDEPPAHAADYLDLIDRIREARPDIAISGDFIVGFPGESDADFEATLDLVRQVGYAPAYSFKYSPASRHARRDMADQVPDEVKAERLQRLQALLQAQQHAFNRSLLGREADVLIEKPRPSCPARCVGRSPWLQSVIVDASAGEIGDIVKVRITEAGPLSLKRRGSIGEPAMIPARHAHACRSCGKATEGAASAFSVTMVTGIASMLKAHRSRRERFEKATRPEASRRSRARAPSTTTSLPPPCSASSTSIWRCSSSSLGVDAGHARQFRRHSRRPAGADPARRLALDTSMPGSQSGDDDRARRCRRRDPHGDAAEDQLTLPTLEKAGRLAMAQIATRKKVIQARTPDAGRLYARPGPLRTRLRHRPGRHRQDLSRRRLCRHRCSSAAPSSASSCRARRSRPASGSASCPAT